jgi:hypothetical protein
VNDDDGYQGPATLKVGGVDFPVEVTLAGYFQPLDGRYHWYGRFAADPALTSLASLQGSSVTVITPTGQAEGLLGEADLWDRLRVEGSSTPPFAIDYLERTP